MSAIEIHNLTKYFGDVKAVSNVSLEVESGEIFGFLGPNGAGKSTTIRCMMDFIRPSRGKVTILGKDAQEHSAQLKQEIGFLAAEHHLYELWTGQEHIDYVANVRGVTPDVSDLLERFKFDPSKRVKEYSTGNRQKLGLILALIHNPMILILDEPTSGLDPLLQQEFYEIIRSKVSDGTTIFMSSHNLAEVERLCERVAIIKEGVITGVYNIQDIKAKQIYNILLYKRSDITADDVNKLHAIEGLEVTDKIGSNGVQFVYKKDINDLLNTLNEFDVQDIEITHANLETIFLEFYK